MTPTHPTGPDTYPEEVIVKLACMVDEERIDVLKIETLDPKEIKKISKELGFIKNETSTTKSDIALR